MKRIGVALALLLVLLLPILLMGALLAIAGEDLTPSEKALKEIPPDLLSVYTAAAEICDGLDWTILAAIHKIETNFGRGRATSSKGAQGPMQFMPSTWDAYGADGNGDGVADINNVLDAIFSAAFMLCENGAGDPARLADSIWHYNNSDEYVAEVLDLAASYGVVALGSTAVAAPSDLLNNPRITLTANAQADIEAGVVDARLLALLDAISHRYTLGVTVFKTGHSIRTRSGSISNHVYGRAADIFFVDAVPVSSSNRAAREVVEFLGSLEEGIRPDEIGHPFADVQVVGSFTDADHRDHIHIGFD